MTTQNAQPKYFNLHTSGIGYLSDIREIKPKKGEAFWACRIAALTGSSDAPEYRFFDMNVTGQDRDYHKNADTGVSIKGRLYRINFIKVDGELKYQAKRQDEQGND